AWNAFDYLDVNRHLSGLPDWTHGNALMYSPSDGNLLFFVAPPVLGYKDRLSEWNRQRQRALAAWLSRRFRPRPGQRSESLVLLPTLSLADQPERRANHNRHLGIRFHWSRGRGNHRCPPSPALRNATPAGSSFRLTKAPMWRTCCGPMLLGFFPRGAARCISVSRGRWRL